jgi:hypothetical protein
MLKSLASHFLAPERLPTKGKPGTRLRSRTWGSVRAKCLGGWNLFVGTFRKYLINRVSTHYTYSMFSWNIECKHVRRVISWDWRTLTQDAPRVCQVKPLLHIWQSWSMNLKVGVQPGFWWLETYFRAPRNFTRPWVLSDNVWKHSSMFKAAFPVIWNWQ